jgi:hypothetical protein
MIYTFAHVGAVLQMKAEISAKEGRLGCLKGSIYFAALELLSWFPIGPQRSSGRIESWWLRTVESSIPGNTPISSCGAGPTARFGSLRISKHPPIEWTSHQWSPRSQTRPDRPIEDLPDQLDLRHCSCAERKDD